MDIPQILHPSRLRVVEDGEGGAFFALSPETQAQLDRIEEMLKRLLGDEDDGIERGSIPTSEWSSLFKDKP